MTRCLMKKSKDTDGKKQKRDLHDLQIELVKLQSDLIKKRRKLLVIFEGRDGAGKDSTIKRLTEHLSPRETRVVALGKPSDREISEWYFQRFVPWLPAAGEFVIFNRSWYNRAGVEHVMGFCTEKEYIKFIQDVPVFESMLTNSSIELLKYYLDISEDEQKARLAERRRDPLKQWKVSPIDAAAIKHWKDYTKARDDMLMRTHSKAAPWIVVNAYDKPIARNNLIRDLLGRVKYKGCNDKMTHPDKRIVDTFTPEMLTNGRLAR
jgi:polyphosphate kinase 2